jgi:hypothetical protein
VVGCLFFLALPVAWGLIGTIAGSVVGRRVVGLCGGVLGGFAAYLGYAVYVSSLPGHVVQVEWGPKWVVDHPPPGYMALVCMAAGAALGGLLLAAGAAARGR